MEDYDAFMTLISYLMSFGMVQYDQNNKIYTITQTEVKNLWKEMV